MPFHRCELWTVALLFHPTIQDRSRETATTEPPGRLLATLGDVARADCSRITRHPVRYPVLRGPVRDVSTVGARPWTPASGSHTPLLKQYPSTGSITWPTG